MKKFYKPVLRPIRYALRRMRGKRFVKSTPVAGRLSINFYRDPRNILKKGGLSAGSFPDDDSIIERIVAAYKHGRDDSSNPSAMWQLIYDTRQVGIHDILMSGEAGKIRGVLQRPGQSSLFFGFDNIVDGIVRLARRSPKYRDLLERSPSDQLLYTAEIMGAIRFENREATLDAYRGMSSDDVIGAIERHLGINLSFPNPFPDEVGAASGRGIVSFRAAHALYQAWRIRELVKAIPNPRVLEIGGGLGRTALHARQMGITDYTIIDLPFTAVSQGYFLMRTLGEDAVALHGEPAGRPDQVKLLQPSAFLDGDSRYDLVVNVDSMTEMDRSVAEGYWRRIKATSPLFLSINHEFNPFTIAEIAQSDLVSISWSQRYPYSLRKGYAEEIFRFSSAEIPAR